MKMMVEVFTAEEAQKIALNARSKAKQLMLEYAMEEIKATASADYWTVTIDLRVPLNKASIRLDKDNITWVKNEIEKLGYALMNNNEKTPYKFNVSWNPTYIQIFGKRGE